MADRTTKIPEEGVLPPGSGAGDATLGGYLHTHRRPPAFQGSDHYPYTVSLETEKTPDLTAPFQGYLVFPRWASTGAGIVGHLETATLCRGRTRQEVEERLRRLSLQEVQHLLEEAIRLESRET